jgi:hypothetical protein
MKQIPFNVQLLKTSGLINDDVISSESIKPLCNILQRAINPKLEMKISEFCLEVNDDFDESCLLELLTNYCCSTISALDDFASKDSSLTQSEQTKLIKRAKELEMMNSNGISEALRPQKTQLQEIMVIEDIEVAYQKHQFNSKSSLAGVSITKKELGLNNRKLAINHLSELELKKLKQFLDNKNRTHDPISLQVEATINGFGQIIALKFLSYE